MINAFKYGLKIGFGQKGTALIAYFLQFLLALPVGLQIYQVMEASIGNSLEINKLLGGYNDTVVTDLLNVHGASLSPLLGQLRWVLLVYLIVSVFINAGLLHAVSREEKGWKIFWEGGAVYFFRFLKVALFFVAIAAVWTGIVWVPFLGFFQKSPEVFSSEKISVLLLLVVLLFYFLGLFFLFNWSLVCRLKILEEGMRVGSSLKKGLAFSVRHFFSLLGLLLLFLFLQILCAGIYWWAEDSAGMVSPILIFLFFIFQQLLIFSRWIFKIAIYGGMRKIYLERSE